MIALGIINIAFSILNYKIALIRIKEREHGKALNYALLAGLCLGVGVMHLVDKLVN
jgi:hypothetical protein